MVSQLSLQLATTNKDSILPLVPKFNTNTELVAHQYLIADALPNLPVGTGLFDDSNTEILHISSYALINCGLHNLYCPMLTATSDIKAKTVKLNPQKIGYSLAWITLSDKGWQGIRQDSSGPVIADLLSHQLPLCQIQGFLIPDEPSYLKNLITELALGQNYDLICTSGSTGVGPRDIAPQTLAQILDLDLPNFSTAMFLESLKKTPHACISRAICGILGKSLILSLPGSPKAVRENLNAILPAIPHTLDKIHGDPTDCAS